MTYASQQDLVDRFGADELVQRTDEAGLGEIDAVKGARPPHAADTLINGYVAGRYQVPLAPVPELVRELACDIARYRLYTISATELVRRNYEDALKRLEAIQAGKITLDVAGVEPPSGSGSEVLIEAPGRVFTRDSLAGF